MSLRPAPFFLLIAAALFGFWTGYTPEKKIHPVVIKGIHPEKEFPLLENKSFAIVVYAHNHSFWCEKTLSSIFEQEHDSYRVIFVDDASSDDTFEKAKKFLSENQLEERALLIRNETKIGLVASLYLAADKCLDKEIILPLEAKDWLVSRWTLAKLNLAYQNPDVWLAFSPTVEYPSYSLSPKKPLSFYAALFKEIKLGDLFQNGSFAESAEACFSALLQLSGGRIRSLSDPLLFSNRVFFSPEPKPFALACYSPMASFPKEKKAHQKADLILFSEDRPLQLYASLESVYAYLSGFDKIFAVYSATDERFKLGYEKVKAAFPKVSFFNVKEQNFKELVSSLVFASPSNYVAFASDGVIVKDFADLCLCSSFLEKTHALAFYLSLGSHIRAQGDSLQKFAFEEGVLAWNIESAEGEWGKKRPQELALYPKSELKSLFSKIKFNNPASFKLALEKQPLSERAVGLCFEHSKALTVPLGGQDSLTAEELLAKFDQGLKINIESLYKAENPLSTLDIIPEFVLK